MQGDEVGQDQMARKVETAGKARSLHLAIDIHPERIFRILLVVVALVVITGTLANLVIFQIAPSPEHRLARLMHRFDLGFEPSLPNWYSSLTLLIYTLLLWLIGTAHLRARNPFAQHWLGLAVVFSLLALDENIMLHEMVSAPLQEFLNSSGILYLAWVLPGLLLVFLFGLANLKFLAQLEPRTRRPFLVAGVTFVAGAILSDPVNEALGASRRLNTPWFRPSKNPWKC